MKDRLINIPEIILINIATDILNDTFNDDTICLSILDRNFAYDIIINYLSKENINPTEYFNELFQQFEILPGIPNIDV